MAATKSIPSKTNPDAIDMLMEDHAKVKKLFKAFEKIKDGEKEAEIANIVTTACAELKVHSQLEKEIFYPAVKLKAKGELADQLAEAEVEHEAVDALVEKLLTRPLDDLAYKANFTVLVEFVEHHVKEEENEMFPLVRKQKGLDLKALAAEMKARKEELKSEFVEDTSTQGENIVGVVPRGGKTKAQRGSRASH